MENLAIDHFPMPPSSNELYAWSRYSDRMVKTKAYKEYERTANNWVVTHPQQVLALRMFTKDLGPQVFHIDTNFYMPKASIVCLSGKPKKNDTSNRLKALYDVLSTIIGIDDCYFWSGSFTKFAMDITEPYVTINFRLRGIYE